MSTYINLTTLEYPLFQGDVRLQADCGPKDAFVLPQGYAVVMPPAVYPTLGPYDSYERDLPELIDGVWYERFNVKTMSPEEIVRFEEWKAASNPHPAPTPRPNFEEMPGSAPNVID